MKHLFKKKFEKFILNSNLMHHFIRGVILSKAVFESGNKLVL